MEKVLFIIITLLLLSGCGDNYDIVNIDSSGENIICFGDSITEGQGASKGNDYPTLLSQLIGGKVVNAGVSGDTTYDALMRIEKDVLSKDPKIVVVEFGGNDFLRRVPVKETLKNIILIIERIQDKGSMVVLVSVKTSMFDPYIKRLRKIAKNKGVYLVENILKGIMKNREFKSDGLHPNDAGYKFIAERVSVVLKQLNKKNKDVRSFID